jgi:hypothetical protein
MLDRISTKNSFSSKMHSNKKLNFKYKFLYKIKLLVNHLMMHPWMKIQGEDGEDGFPRNRR